MVISIHLHDILTALDSSFLSSSLKVILHLFVLPRYEPIEGGSLLKQSFHLLASRVLLINGARGCNVFLHLA